MGRRCLGSIWVTMCAFKLPLHDSRTWKNVLEKHYKPEQREIAPHEISRKSSNKSFKAFIVMPRINVEGSNEVDSKHDLMIFPQWEAGRSKVRACVGVLRLTPGTCLIVLLMLIPSRKALNLFLLFNMRQVMLRRISRWGFLCQFLGSRFFLFSFVRFT